MSRRHSATKREILPDAKYGDLVISKLINCVMTRGKKSAAERIVYGAIDIIRTKRKLGSDVAVVDFVKESIGKLKPQVEVRSRRVGGATYQVPVEVRPERQQAMALKWLIEAARNRPENTMTERLAEELMMAANDNGAAAKKKEETHKMAEANRAFAHYRW
jgi:small subunit ribosomal protein S7